MTATDARVRAGARLWRIPLFAWLLAFLLPWPVGPIVQIACAVPVARLSKPLFMGMVIVAGVHLAFGLVAFPGL